MVVRREVLFAVSMVLLKVTNDYLLPRYKEVLSKISDDKVKSFVLCFIGICYAQFVCEFYERYLKVKKNEFI